MTVKGDETIRCASCRSEVLMVSRGPLWKGVQLDPDEAELTWYCREREPCVKAFDEACIEAAHNWGMGEDPMDPEIEPTEEPPKGPPAEVDEDPEVWGAELTFRKRRRGG